MRVNWAWIKRYCVFLPLGSLASVKRVYCPWQLKIGLEQFILPLGKCYHNRFNKAGNCLVEWVKILPLNIGLLWWLKYVSWAYMYYILHLLPCILVCIFIMHQTHCTHLTHWPLGDLNVILKMSSSILLYWVVSSNLLTIMSSEECHRTLLMIRQHWFR